MHAVKHDEHHEFFNYNFGDWFMDELCGTTLPPNLQKKVDKRKEEQLKLFEASRNKKVA